MTAPELPRRPPAVGARGLTLLLLLVAGALSYEGLGLTAAGLAPNEGGLAVAREFFGRALSPAWTSEARFVPPGTPPLLLDALGAAGRTVLYAAAAMSLALVIGVVLGFLASSSWRVGERRFLGRAATSALWFSARAIIAAMRSVHELLWAVLLLAAMGLSDLAALVAIALPYGGTLAKIFSELIDEAPRDAGEALRGAGAPALSVFAFALVPRAAPDMIAYTFYRFECALRSSAVLGFFGFPTLGLELRQSFRSTNYGEVWTYLYVLIALVIVFDGWSGHLRRRLVTT
ncbi:MAG: PhnE/PtxC family ABC transporter permease [Planctomycetota bacterium JB042]